MEQLGTVAGKQYQGDGLSVAATPEGAWLRCVFQKLEGQATREGLWLTSTATGAKGERFRMVASAVGREAGERSADLESAFRERMPQAGYKPALLPAVGKVAVAEQTARFIRPGVTEEYSVSVDGARQDFVIEHPHLDSQPSTLNPRAGQLRVELVVTGAKAEPLGNGVRLVLNGSGRKIAYNRLRVTDATGKELPARMVVESDGEAACQVLKCDSPLSLSVGSGPFQSARGLAQSKTLSRLAVLVDDADAVDPVRIDPTFSDENWHSMGLFPGADGWIAAATANNTGNTTAAAVGISGIMLTVGSAIAMNGHSRALETEADQLAAIYLLKNGKDPRLLARVLRKLRYFPDLIGEGDTSGHLFSTHPALDDRIDMAEHMSLKLADKPVVFDGYSKDDELVATISLEAEVSHSSPDTHDTLTLLADLSTTTALEKQEKVSSVAFATGGKSISLSNGEKTPVDPLDSITVSFQTKRSELGLLAQVDELKFNLGPVRRRERRRD